MFESRSTVACFLVLLSFGCARPKQVERTKPTQESAYCAHDVEVLKDLTLIAIGTPGDPDELQRKWVRGICEGAETIEGFVDHLLAKPEASDVAPSILFPQLLFPGYGALPERTLKSQTAADGTHYYYLYEECEIGKLAKVAPWWSPKETVLVCEDSYRPDRFVSPTNKFACDSYMTRPSVTQECGCGPNLARCMPNEQMMLSSQFSLMSEVARTIAHYVSEGKPVKEAFLGPRTHRDKLTELQYLRWRMESERLPELPQLDELASWPSEGKLASRYEYTKGQHAGVATAPNTVFLSCNLRAAVHFLYRSLWCLDGESMGIPTEQVVGLSASIRGGEDWERLTKTPFCSDCHARLDHSMRYLRGWPDPREGRHYRPEAQPSGTGYVYGESANELVATTEIAPNNLLQSIVADDRFGACMSRRLTEWVHADRVTEQHYEQVRERFSTDGTFGGAMKIALLQYAAMNRRNVVSSGRSRVSSLMPGGSTVRPPVVEVAPRFRAAIERHCDGCHGEGDELDFSGAKLERTRAQQMLSQVAYGWMPKGSPLSSDDRHEFVAAASDVLWPDEPNVRALALSYFIDHLGSATTHSDELSLTAVRAEIAEPRAEFLPPNVRAISSGPMSELTPTLAARTVLEAMWLCAEAGLGGDELQDCVQRATRPDVLLK